MLGPVLQFCVAVLLIAFTMSLLIIIVNTTVNTINRKKDPK